MTDNQGYGDIVAILQHKEGTFSPKWWLPLANDVGKRVKLFKDSGDV